MNNKDKLSQLKNRTPEERADLLIKAKILDENGNYLPEYFPETIKQQKLKETNK